MADINFDKIKPGALKRQLKVSQDYTFKLKDLDKMAKTPNGKSVMFEGRNIKMTPLLKRRVNFARNAKRFASKNKGKDRAKNPIDLPLLIESASRTPRFLRHYDLGVAGMNNPFLARQKALEQIELRDLPATTEDGKNIATATLVGANGKLTAAAHAKHFRGLRGGGRLQQRHGAFLSLPDQEGVGPSKEVVIKPHPPGS